MNPTATPPRTAQEAALAARARREKWQTALDRKRKAVAKRNAEAPSEAAIDICTGLLERRKEAIARMLAASEEIREIDTTLEVLGGA